VANRTPDLDTVATHALIVDGPRVLENVRTQAARASDAGVDLWPHTKTHKSVGIARLQVENGAAGLTLATVREAERMAEFGFGRILLAHLPGGTWRLALLTALAGRARLRVAADSLEVVLALEDACARAGVGLGYLWEVDCGLRRTGTAPGAKTRSLVERAVEATAWASFEGLMAYPRHAYKAGGSQEIEEIAREETRALVETGGLLAEAGMEARCLSAGSTLTSPYVGHRAGITEVRPANYVYYDATQVALGVADKETCALSVLGTVVSRSDPRRLILDCGSKALGAEVMSPLTRGFGFVVGHDGLLVERLMAEHSIVTPEEPIGEPVGARLRVVPNHSCVTNNVHDRMLVVEDGQVADGWTVDARGWEEAA
jgi:D-serine deaminase-like pyridoxal phosphate-dependent protein